jgi:uncharacterized membrane protein YphA (DoxX/SURF4 family)
MKISKFRKKYHKQILGFWFLARFCVGFLLIISAIRMYSSIKLDFDLMLASLSIPKFFSEILWVILPWIKLYTGGFLILGIFTRFSALASVGLHSMSVLVLMYIKIAEIKIYSSPCSIVSYGNCNFAFTFNISLITLSAIIYLLNSDKLTFDGWVKQQE